MPAYAQGQPVTISTEVRLRPVPPATVGVLVTPTTILLRVRKPDGTFLPDYSTPTEDSTGKYHQDIPASDLDDLGPYQYVWITEGSGAGVSPPAGFDVVDPFTPTHVAFGDAKDRLNLSAASDAEVQALIASAVAEQEVGVGAVAPRTITETLWAHGGVLRLGRNRYDGRPVITVQSATVNGQSVDITNWEVRSSLAGVVRVQYGYLFGLYTVTYIAGRNPVPADLTEAALLRVAFAYDRQRGGSGGLQAGGGFSLTEGEGSSAFHMLSDAERLEAGHILPGFG